MKKDTNNNCEVIARMMEAIYRRFGGLPMHMSLVQDNCCRECKNNKIIKFFTRLKVHGIVEEASLGYPIKGHSHGPLDATFGQATVKLAQEEFDDDAEAVDVLNDFLKDSRLDFGTKEDARAYKLDEAADWESWWNLLEFHMSSLTGPAAPHYFRICSRGRLGHDGGGGDGVEELKAPRAAWDGAPAPQFDDVVMVVKERMASAQVLQVVTLVAAEDLPRLRASPLQPRGAHPRRLHAEGKDKEIARAAVEAARVGAIRPKAKDYLVGWASGTRRRAPRLSSYTFLEYRAPTVADLALSGSARPGGRAPVGTIAIASTGGGSMLPLQREEDDDVEPGPLIVA